MAIKQAKRGMTSITLPGLVDPHDLAVGRARDHDRLAYRLAQFLERRLGHRHHVEVPGAGLAQQPAASLPCGTCL